MQFIEAVVLCLKCEFENDNTIHIIVMKYQGRLKTRSLVMFKKKSKQLSQKIGSEFSHC